jgi:hypothetical protein
MMRRALAVVLATAATTWPMAVASQPSATMPRLCYLEFGRDASERFHAFFETLRSLGRMTDRPSSSTGGRRKTGPSDIPSLPASASTASLTSSW